MQLNIVYIERIYDDSIHLWVCRLRLGAMGTKRIKYRAPSFCMFVQTSNGLFYILWFTSLEHFIKSSNQWFYAVGFFSLFHCVSVSRYFCIQPVAHYYFNIFHSLAHWNGISFLSSLHSRISECMVHALFFHIKTHAFHFINHQRLMVSLVIFIYFFFLLFRCACSRFSLKKYCFHFCGFLLWFTILCMLMCLSVRKNASVCSVNIHTHIYGTYHGMGCVWIFA